MLKIVRVSKILVIYIYIYKKEIMLSDTNKGLGVLSTSIAKLLLDIKLWVVYSVDNK